MGDSQSKLMLVHQLVKLEDLFTGAVLVILSAAFASGGAPFEDPLRLMAAAAFCMLGLASVNALNQIYDVELDEVNKPGRPIPSGALTRKQVLGISIGLSACAGLLTLYLGWSFLLIALAGLGIGLAYSHPWVRARNIPMVSIMVLATGYALLTFLVGWAVYEPLGTAPLWILAFLYLHEIASENSKDFPDLEGDRRGGVRTIPVIFGKRTGAGMCFLMYMIPFLFLAFLRATGVITLDVVPLMAAGAILGALTFGFASMKEKKYNVIGYVHWMIAALVIRAMLFMAWIQM